MSKCEKCDGTGIIEIGNIDLPCNCPAGDKALFTIGVNKPISGEALRDLGRYLLVEEWDQDSLTLLFLLYHSTSSTGQVNAEKLFDLFGGVFEEPMRSLNHRDLVITNTKLIPPTYTKETYFQLTNKGRREAKRIRLEMTY